MGAFDQAAALYRQVKENAERAAQSGNREVQNSAGLLAIRAEYAIAIADKLAQQHPSRSVDLADLDQMTPGTTHPGRLVATHSYIASSVSSSTNGRLLVFDVGTGYVPVTTLELAEALEGQAKVVGVDRIIPHFTLEVHTDLDGVLLPLGEESVVFFDAEGRLVYGFSGGRPLAPYQVERALAMKERLLPQLQGKSSGTGTTEVTDEYGNRLTSQPFARYERTNL